MWTHISITDFRIPLQFIFLCIKQSKFIVVRKENVQKEERQYLFVFMISIPRIRSVLSLLGIF